MPSAVLDLDLENLPQEIAGLNAYSRAFILLRYHGKPVGKIILPVVEGRLFIEEFHTQILDAAGPVLREAWLHHYLEWDERDLPDCRIHSATIAVCTRDRTDDLRRCLDSLMALPDEGQEIIVIDNCPSTDDTLRLVESYARIRYVNENRPGLNIARNRAIRELSNDIVAFTDDDACVDPEWLRVILRNFDNPQVCCVTGMTLPLELETEGQEAFEKYNSFAKGFRRRVHSNKTRNPLSTGGIGAGVNMAVRRSVHQDIGFFDVALDAGTPTQSGGDHEFFSRILVAGFLIVYDPTALSWHRHRLTLEETRKAIKGYGVGVYAFWTRCLFVGKELGIIKFPINWFLRVQFPNLIKAIIRKPGSQPLGFVLAELSGCAKGAWAYFLSRNRLKAFKKGYGQ